MDRRATLIVTLAFGLAGLSIGAQKSPPRPSIAIENVTVVDVVNGRVSDSKTVLITDGRIAGLDEPGKMVIPPGTIRVDGKGRYLMPGLVDMHVHLFNNASHRPPNDWAFPLFVANGVTAVREMRSTAADLKTIARWRDDAAKGELIAPRVLAAGVAVRGDSPDAARRDVRDAHAAGAAFIKIFSEVPVTNWHAILEEARALRIPVCGHIPAEVSVLEAAKAGQRSNEHLTQVYEACSAGEKKFLAKRHGLTGEEATRIRDAEEAKILESFDNRVCEETAKTLTRAEQAQVPTLVLPYFEAQAGRKQFRADPRWPLLRTDEQQRWERIIDGERNEIDRVAAKRWEISRAIVRILNTAGARILAGTDSPMPLVYPGFSLHQELELLAESGLSPANALRSATIWPAEFLGVTESSGSIAVGKRADLVLLDDNPLGDIRNTRQIRAVVLDGRLLDRAQLDALQDPGRPR